MKHFFQILLLPLLAVGVLGSCNSIVYDEEYSKDGFYHGKNNVYFYYENPDDTLRQYSFGAQPESMTSQTVKLSACSILRSWAYWMPPSFAPWMVSACLPAQPVSRKWAKRKDKAKRVSHA